MPTYNVNIRVTYKTTITVTARDEEDAYDKVESRIEKGELNLDLSKELEDYDINEDFEDISEEVWGDEMYHMLRDDGVF